MTALLLALACQDIDRWLEQLGADDPAAREKAATALVERWEDDAVVAALKKARHAEGAAALDRIELRRALGKEIVAEAGKDLEDEAAMVKRLEGWMGKLPGEGEACRRAARAIGARLTGRESHAEIRRLVHNRVLAKKPARDWAHALAPVLRSPRAQDRAEAAYVIGRSGAAELGAEVAALLDDREKCQSPYSRLVEEAPVRAAAIEALGRLGAKDAARRIAELLKDGHASVRRNAAAALGELGARDAAKDIAGLLEDKDVRVRIIAPLALGKLGAREHAGAVAARLKDDAWWVRESALEALASIGTKEQAAEIATLLGDPIAEVRGGAAQCLAALGCADRAGEIAALLGDAHHMAIASAALALKRLKAKGHEEALRTARARASKWGRFSIRDWGAGAWRESVSLEALIDEALAEISR
jgi:serine/threonine-protein kinase